MQHDFMNNDDYRRESGPEPAVVIDYPMRVMVVYVDQCVAGFGVPGFGV
jgi:hypothetical protein